MQVYTKEYRGYLIMIAAEQTQMMDFVYIYMEISKIYEHIKHFNIQDHFCFNMHIYLK